MDWLESIVENRIQDRECLESTKQNLEQYQEYLNELTENLHETQQKFNENSEILEINNVTKNAFNEYSKEVKTLIGLVYKLKQQVGDKLGTVIQSTQAMKDLLGQNVANLKNIETHFKNQLRALETEKNCIKDQLDRERNQLLQETSFVDQECQKWEETWKNTLEQYNENRQQLEAIKMEIDIIQDGIDKDKQEQEELLKERSEVRGKVLGEMDSSVEMSESILKVEEKIFTSLNQMNQLSERKTNLLCRENEMKRTLEDLKTECERITSVLNTTKKEHTERIANMTNEIETTRKLLEENENKFSASKTKTDNMKKETENLHLRISTLDEELALLQKSIQEATTFLGNNNVKKITEDNENLLKDCENLSDLLTKRKNEIGKRQQDLVALKTTPNPELVELQQKLKSLETARIKNADNEKEIEELELNNRNYQQTVEQYQKAIKDYIAKRKELRVELDENNKQLSSVTKQCEAAEKEIKQWEVSQKVKAKSPKVPSKRPHKQTNVQPAKKHGSAMDMDSDSSVDGGGMSYAEFLAKKTLLKVKRIK